MDYSKHFNTRETSQSEKVPGKDQVLNSAGGYVFSVTPEIRLERFLILGTEGGTYYVGERKLTIDNANSIIDLISKKGKYVVDTVVEISDKGRAPKNDPALFVLALCASAGLERPSKQDIETRQYALSKLFKVARTGTHLFHFAQYVSSLRGFGKTLRKALASWYLEKPNDKLALQVIKYQARDGWSHRDILRLSHPKIENDDSEKMNILAWVANNPKRPFELKEDGPLGMIWAYEQVLKSTSETEIVSLMNKYGLPIEAIPSEKQSSAVYEAYYHSAGLGWLLKNLGNLSKHNILAPNSIASKIIRDKLTDKDALRKARIHPVDVLKALRTYSSGHSFKGSGSWTVVQPIVDTLADVFYLTFSTIEPSGKNFMLGIDVSKSMEDPIYGMNMSSCEAATVMAMVTAKTEKNYHIMGFADSFRDLGITAKDTLQSAAKKAQFHNFGRTDASLAITYALNNKIPVDVFGIYTDNETWRGKIHPFQALKQYREKMGINAKLVSVATTATSYSIADPSDAGMMDVCGFDTNTPKVISDFAR